MQYLIADQIVAQLLTLLILFIQVIPQMQKE